MQNIFVTGGTGFLGAYIIKHLVQNGYSVRALRRSAPLPFFIEPQVFEKVEWITGDVLDVVSLAEAIEGCDGIIHAAAVVSYQKNDKALLHSINAEGTANVVNAAIEAGVQRFVHVSSIAALGRGGKPDTVTENRAWEDNSSNTEYGITKHLAELEVFRGFAEGLQGVIINPSLILGFGNWNASSCALFKSVYNGFPWYAGGVNGFVGVEDVARAAVQLLQSGEHAKRFIVSAENRPLREVFNTIADGLGKRRPHRRATPFLGELAWRAEGLKALLSGRKPLLTRETARNAHSKTYFDNSALLAALPGFTFAPINTVIADACKKYQAALAKGVLA